MCPNHLRSCFGFRGSPKRLPVEEGGGCGFLGGPVVGGPRGGPVVGAVKGGGPRGGPVVTGGPVRSDTGPVRTWSVLGGPVIGGPLPSLGLTGGGILRSGGL